MEEEDRWFDISGVDAPTQTYWSVEYLPESKVARFGTYGRGIWDFEIEEITTSNKNTTKTELELYPNPSVDYIQINGLSSDRNYLITNSTGQVMTTFVGSEENQRLDVSTYPSGTYYLTESSGQNTISFTKL